MWNLRARMIYYQGFEAASHFEWLHHPDYPPLFPAITALGYHIFGDTPAVNIVLHGVVVAATILMFRQWWALVIMGVVAVFYGPFQYIDLSVALAFLVAVKGYATRRDVAAGLALGVMLLLKNEGLPTALIFLAVWTIADRRLPLRALLGLTPGVLLLVAWRLWIDQPTDLFSGGESLARALDLSRQAIILPAMLYILVAFGWGVNVLVIVWAIILRIRIHMIAPLVAIGLIFLMDWGIYTISYWDPVTDHIYSSWDRLILQVFPVFLFVLGGARRLPVQDANDAEAQTYPETA